MKKITEILLIKTLTLSFIIILLTDYPDAYAQQGGEATGGASISGASPCYGTTCSYNYYGGQATGGAATNNNMVKDVPPLEDSLTSNKKFYSSKDLFVTNPAGYGVYDTHSNTFKPGEDIVLYIEPVGFEYGTIDKGYETLYTIDFTADFIIYDKSGTPLTSQKDIPVSQIISHNQNKEVFIPFTISQTEPFPEGEYVIKYIITDDNSNNILELNKDITISDNVSF